MPRANRRIIDSIFTQLRIYGWSLSELTGSQDVSISGRLDGHVEGRALASHEDIVDVVPASTHIFLDGLFPSLTFWRTCTIDARPRWVAWFPSCAAPPSSSSPGRSP
jgi:hypothetical protein